jgi:hypothetical protein
MIKPSFLLRLPAPAFVRKLLLNPQFPRAEPGTVLVI